MQNKFSRSKLFHDVQLSDLFPDSKTFADAICLSTIEEVESSYASQRLESEFDLRSFIDQHFKIPNELESTFKTDPSNDATQHVNSLWDVLSRAPDKNDNDSLIPLPHPYIVPGGRFREIYYWDSYFTMLGLIASKRLDLVRHMIANFKHMILRYGFIPNGNRTYFLSRSQPPFFALMIDLLESQGQAIDTFKDALEKEYDFWMTGDRLVKSNDLRLNRYWDSDPTPRPESYAEDFVLGEKAADQSQLFLELRAACESGWDFSSRWLTDDALSSIETTNILPVDLNCLLYFLEDKIGKHQVAGERASAINQLMWNEKEGYYFDYNIRLGEQTQVESLAGVFPLFMKIASPEQANLVANYLKRHFLQPGGLTTTTLNTGQQWDAPNGWAPLQWIAVKGLLNYGFDELAAEIANRWIDLNESVFLKTGKFVEKYNVYDLDLEAGGGEYPVQDGFGWSNGVYLAMKQLFHQQ